MATIYLDVDDEITSAASRIRGSKDARIALVLPSGSRIATSRINFKLLQREAQEHGRRLAVITPEASARALAASAGLPSFATVRDYEEEAEGVGARTAAGAGGDRGGRAGTGPGGGGTEEAGIAAAAAAGTAGTAEAATRGGARDQARRLSEAEIAARASAGKSAEEARRIRDGGPARGESAGGTRDASGATAGEREGAGRGAMGSLPIARRRLDPQRRGLVIGGVVGLFLLCVAGVAGYLLLPTAKVVLALRSEVVGPLDLVVHADPQAAVPDAAALVVPAITIDLPLSASGTFAATGKRSEDKPARGTLVWTNCDPTRSYTVPKDTVARTSGGTGFSTDEAIFLPVATLNPPQIGCQKRSVTATATKPGPASNVPAHAIDVVPGSYNSVVIFVDNPSAMSGGSHKDFPKVQQADVDAAVAALSAQLDEQLAGAAAAPVDLPAGATVFPDTATRGDAQPGVDPATLVGGEFQTFDLSMTATGTVLAVDPSPIRGLGAARLAAAVPAGHDVVAGSASITVSDGSVDQGIISYRVTATEQTVPRVDADALRAQVKGKTPTQVRSLLAGMGDVTIALWPDWAGSVTGFDPRLDFSVTGPPVETPGSSPSVAPATARPTPRPSASPASSSGSPEASPASSPAAPDGSPAASGGLASPDASGAP